jgi:chaperonin GroES
MKVRPVHDRLLVKRIEGAGTMQEGLLIPDTAKEKPLEGRIVAVGEGQLDQAGKLRPLDMFRGQRVLFDRSAGTELRLDGEEYLIIREEDVLAVLE